MRALGVAQLLAALSAGATSALLVVYARQALGTDGAGYGVLLAAIGIGAALGPLALLRLVREPRRPLLVFGPFAVRGLVDLALAATSRLPVAAAALAGYGLATSTGAVTFNSVLQSQTPDHVRGRVFASMDLLWQTGRLASLAIGAALADTIGIRTVYVLGGLLLLTPSTPRPPRPVAAAMAAPPPSTLPPAMPSTSPKPACSQPRPHPAPPRPTYPWDKYGPAAGCSRPNANCSPTPSG